MENNKHKRQWRNFPEDAKQKVSDALKGKPKSDSHKTAISNSMSEYWKGVPNKPKDTPMDEFLGMGE